MRRFAILTISCMIPLGSAWAQSTPEENLSDFPVVPVSKIVNAENQAKQQSGKSEALAQAKETGVPKTALAAKDQKTKEDKADKTELVLEPGVNEIIPISVGHPNRFSLPFDSPRVRTTSSASFDVEGRSLYVSSNAEGQPITAFLTDKDNPNAAMSVTFVPRRIPPIDLKLKLDTSGVQFAANNKKAKAWEESQPYVQSIRDMLREVANNEIPQGYTLNENPLLTNFKGCHQPGLSFKFEGGQAVEGHQLKVNIGVVQNISKQTIEFREPSCAADDVRAVAAWPKPLLKPGERSEIYVVRDISHAPQQNHNSRNSLLGE